MTVGDSVRYPSREAAESFIERSTFPWHQRFLIAPGVHTPGVNDIDWLLDAAQVSDDLSGLTVLDVGTANGGAAFEAERRGASRVVAVDIFPPEWFGFDALKELLGSNVGYLRASTYQLTEAFKGERFDVVLFLGVLYHLRHPLLALDNLREVTRGTCYLETAVADHDQPDLTGSPIARFYRRDELNGDPSNWFVPTVAALEDWCGSSGFEYERVAAWPADEPSRCLLKLRVAPEEPEFSQLSYERPFGRLPDVPIW